MIHILLAVIYIAFVSLGLPDALLGAAWPVIYREFSVPVSWMGPVSLIISASTVVSSLLSDRINRRIGTGRVTALSVFMTALSLLGFSFCRSYWQLCVLAVPYGLGAGSIDASLNNYVALNYSGKHMSWLHCMWGLGAAAGPSVMGAVLGSAGRWNKGYLYIGLLQLVLTGILLLTLPLWKGTSDAEASQSDTKPLSLRQIFSMPKAKAVMITFFCYCALEQTAGQWAGSYFYGYNRISEELSATLAGLSYVGITVGRGVNGFLTVKYSDKALVRCGFLLIGSGLLIMLLPFGVWGSVAGLLLTGLGCAPIYPCLLHSTPEYFGAQNSQAIIGVEMACAYVGLCVAPPVFGMIAEFTGLWFLPVMLIVILAIMFLSHERLFSRKKPKKLRL